MMKTKKDARNFFLGNRSRLSEEEVASKSAVIFNMLCTLMEYRKAGVILAYMSFGNEVLTRPFINRCLSDSKRIALPRVEIKDGSGKMLSAYEVKDPDRDTVPGFKGILEPDPDAADPIDAAKIDLAVIPGVAFDISGNRLGYGAGYYDRYLPALRDDCLKVGVAFEMQMADDLPADEFDFRLDMVITEMKSLRFH